MKVTEEWQPLDTGWIDSPSLIRIENLEGVFQQRIPTVEQRTVAAEKVVEVGRDGVAYALVRPTCVERIVPATVLCVRCRRGEASILVTAYPR